MPNTRPDLTLDNEGVCNACRSYERRITVDWAARKKELVKMLGKYRSKDGSNWDCIVPVSGGKDSTFQVLTMKQLGMNPLCVTATTCDLSDIGRENIVNLQNQGVDYIEVTANREVRRKLNRLGLYEVGDISFPEHVSIFTLPFRISVEYNIPLIIWGENSQNEYGGSPASQENKVLNRQWIQEFGGLLGITPESFIGREGIKKQHLIPYTIPSDEDLKKVGTTGIFLGQYIPWDGYKNALIAQAHGLTTYPVAIEGSCVNYENLDNYQTGIHDYFKYLKFGFSRATDIVSAHIRRGRLTREEGCEIIRLRDGKFPWTYLGKPLKEILGNIDMSVEGFIELCDRYTNKDIFKTTIGGDIVKNADYSPVKLKHADD